MKILTITNLFPPEFIGGYELLMLEIVTMLANKGHEIIVATSPLVNHSESGHTNGIQIRRELSYTGLPSIHHRATKNSRAHILIWATSQ